MDSDLIKALRCIASDTPYGTCYEDYYNLTHHAEKRMNCSGAMDNSIPCPYHQNSYGVCFADGACGEWLNKVADILESHSMNVEQLKERLRKYEASNVPPDEVFMIEEGHGRRCIDIEDVLKIVDEIFEVDKNAEQR